LRSPSCTATPNGALLQAKAEHADTADEMFSKLMGDLVEPRRDFIRKTRWMRRWMLRG
jgi:DNA gyrase subunit B